MEDLLLCFGKDVKTARREYRQFVKDGIEKGRRPEFQGGGLIRSSGGDRVGLLGLEEEEREESDQRVLGSGDFVSNAVKASHDAYDRRTGKRIPLAELSKKVSSYFEIKEEDLRSPVKKRSVTQARAAFGYLSIKKMGFSGREVGRFLNIRGYSAIRRAEMGRIIVNKRPELCELAYK